MNPALLTMMFDRIRKEMGHLLDDSSLYIFDEVASRMRVSHKLYRQGKRDYWGYRINPERALTFQVSERPTSENRVDMYCDIRWKDNPLPIQQDIKVRVWGLSDTLTYREELDAAIIEEKLTDSTRLRTGRVISRFHFDKVNHAGSAISDEYHPLYHVQVGGKSEADELCWHPSSFDIPRIPHHPMDFFLACQLIVINFFPQEYRNIRESAEWNSHLKTTQDILLKDYYRMCLDTIEKGDSLLDILAEI